MSRNQPSFAASASLSAIAWFVSALAGFICVPIVVRGLGADSYGLLALVMAFTGYLGLMEMGLGQAIVRYIAYFRELGHGGTVIAITKRAVVWFTGIGVVGGILLFALTPWLIKHVLDVPAELQSTAITVFRLSAFNFFLGMLLTVASSLLLAFLRFDLMALMTATTGSIASVGPAVLVTLGYGLTEVVIFSIVLNVVALAGYAFFIVRLYRRLDVAAGDPWQEVRRSVMRFAGTTALTKVHEVVSQQTSRVVVGIAGGTVAAAYYQVPNLLSSNVTAMLYKMAQVIFPTGSQLLARNDQEGVRTLYLRTSRVFFLLNGTVTMGMIVFAYPLIRYWVSPEFADKGSWALIIFAVTQMLHSSTMSASNLNLSAARPGINLTFSLVNSVIGLALVYPFTVRWGVAGAAAAGLAGTINVPFFLWFTQRKVLKVPMLAVLRRCYLPTVAGATVCGLAAHYLLLPLAKNLLETLALWVATVLIGIGLSGLLGAVSREDLATGRNLLTGLIGRKRGGDRAGKASP